MRKFFAATLAAAMTLSMAATSFADTNTVGAVELAGPYRYHADSNTMRQPGENKDVIRYGEGAYYLLKIADGKDDTNLAATTAKPISTYKEVEKLKVKTEFEMGEDLVNSVSVVKKYVDANATYGSSASAYGIKTELNSTDGYYYFVEFKVASKQTTADADVVGTLEFNRKADKDVKSTSNSTNDGIGKIKDCEVDFEFNVFYADTYLNNANDLYVKGDVELKYDTNYALKFDCDDEVEFSFGDANNDGTNEGTFTVDVSGQGKLFLNYNTKANEAIADANPGVKMYFVNFNNVKFNRVGEFLYEMDGVEAAYKVVDNKLVAINGVEIGADEVTFNTRTLESYVFADAELVNPTVEVEAPVVDAPVVEAPVTNPSTGANA